MNQPIRTFVEDLSDLFTDTATWRRLQGRDEFGKPTYEDPGTQYKARLVRKNRMVRDSAGDQVVSTAHVWLMGTPAVQPDDEVVLSDGSSPVIASVEIFQDETGLSHTKVFFI